MNERRINPVTVPESAAQLLAEADLRDAAHHRAKRSARLVFTAGGLSAGAAVLVWGAMSAGSVLLASSTLLGASLGVGWYALRALDRSPSRERQLTVRTQSATENKRVSSSVVKRVPDLEAQGPPHVEEGE